MKDAASFIEEIDRLTGIRAYRGPEQIFVYHFPEFEWSLITRYHAILFELELHPEWREKFMLEVEPYLKVLADYSAAPLSHMPFDIYFGIDLHKYFR